MSFHAEGEHLRKAIKWISDERLENPEAKLFKLIEAASLEFDLPPKDEEFLIHLLTQEASEEKE
jgi:hypothetical protein